MSAREISRRTGLTTRQVAHGMAELRDKGMTLPSCEGAQTGRGGPIGRGSGTSPSTGFPTTFGRPSASCHMTSKRLHNVARASGSHLRLRKSTAVRQPMAVSASSLWCISFNRIGPNWPYVHPPYHVRKPPWRHAAERQYAKPQRSSRRPPLVSGKRYAMDGTHNRQLANPGALVRTEQATCLGPPIALSVCTS